MTYYDFPTSKYTLLNFTNQLCISNHLLARFLNRFIANELRRTQTFQKNPSQSKAKHFRSKITFFPSVAKHNRKNTFEQTGEIVMFEGTVIVFLFQKNTTNINLSATSSIWPYIYCVGALFKAHFPLFTKSIFPGSRPCQIS